jgi:hypothetical protein
MTPMTASNEQTETDRRAPALECRALRKAYGSARVVLSHLDFTLAAG